MRASLFLDTDCRRYFRLILSLSVLLVWSLRSQAQVIRYVKQSAAGNGSSWSEASGDLQAMINVSGEGDQVWVAAGTYYSPANGFTMKNGVSIFGGFPSAGTPDLNKRDWKNHNTILSGQNARRVIYNLFTADLPLTGTAVLNGFTIISGRVVGENGREGSYNAKPAYGAGIYNYYASPTITNCIITQNTALGGRGVNIYYPVVSGPSGGSGGNAGGAGMYNHYSSPVVYNCTFSLNIAQGGLGGPGYSRAGRGGKGEGGGLYNQSSSPVLSNCLFADNNSIGGHGGSAETLISQGVPKTEFPGENGDGGAAGGGAIFNHDGQAAIINCTIARNHANGGAAGFPYEDRFTPGVGGLGAGGGIYNESSNTRPKIYNTIVFANTASGTGTDLFNSDNAIPTIAHSLIQRSEGSGSGWDPAFGTDDGNNLTSNPLFSDFDNSDFTLKSTSPAINAGTNTLLSEAGNSKDLSGDRRVFGGKVDMGAYENQTPIIRYVRQGGTGDGLSWSGASADLQAMINLSTVDNEIWVSAGTYKPIYKAGNGSTERDKAFVLKAGVKVLGGFAGTETDQSERNWKTHLTILSGDLDDSGTLTDQDAYHVIIHTDSGGNVPPAVLDGFTVTGGNANGFTHRISSDEGSPINSAYGGGIYSMSSPLTLSNLSITGNAAQFAGAGIYNALASQEILDVTISNNLALYGAAIYNDWNFRPVNLTNVLISGNRNTNQAAGIIHNDNVRGGTTFTNVSIVGNAGVAVNNLLSSIVMRNSIVRGNIGGISTLSPVTPDIFSYCLIQGMAADDANHNLSGNLDPLFVNSRPHTSAPFAGGDYRLLLCSPALNAGNNDYVPDVTVDLAGRNRIFDSTVDLGAYETQDSPTPQGAILYVKQGGPGTGVSWDCALGDLQAAINQAGPGNQIWVAKGTYIPTRKANVVSELTPGNQENAFLLKEGVEIYGGFAGTETELNQRNPAEHETILSGDLASGIQAYHVVLAIGSESNPVTSATRLDGFTVSGGNAGNNSGNTPVNGHSVNQGNGGGIYNYKASPVYSHIKLTANHAANIGGAVFNWAAIPSVSDVEISGNTAGYGAGVGNYDCSPAIETTIISGNAATWGGGIYNNSASPQLKSVLLSGNTGDYGGAMYNVTSSPVLTNVTVSGNTGYAIFNTDHTSAPQLKNTLVYGNTNGVNGGNPTYDHSLVQGVTGSTNNNLDGSTDPYFVSPVAPGRSTGGDYRLMVGPVVGMGSNAAFGPGLSTAKDLSGNNRRVGTNIDMGAYEFQDMESLRVRYVRSGSIGNGLGWPHASGDIQAMISESQPGYEVWVAAGEYQPASGRFFSMKEGVKIFGGFAGTDSPAFDDRNWVQHVTTLKGNGNSVIVNDNNGLTNAAVLDGFTLTGGSAVTGGGMLNHLAYPLINHCVFKGNRATVWGGGIYNDGPGMTTVVNSLLYQNTAQSGGAAFSYENAKPRFTNVTIVNNSADQNGGAVHNFEGAETELVNSIVWGNTQWASSSQLFTVGAGKTKSYFSVLEGGTEAIIGEKETVDIISQNPLFTNAPNGDFTLQGCSPALNIGSAGVLTGFTTDLAGNPRLVSTVDAGAYEYQLSTLTGADRLSVNGHTATIQMTAGQTYFIQVVGDECRSVAAINSNGTSPVSGTVHITTYVDNTVQTYNGSPYVQRHYEVWPVNGASTATARVTLYFTQEEFAAYNSRLGRNALPVLYTDNRTDLKVFQYHGTPKSGYAGPAAYIGPPVAITPDLKWNFPLERWEVSFDVTGFSGFFIGSADAALPVKLISFEGKVTESNVVQLDWQVSEQVDMAGYTVEYSDDARHFVPIGNISADESSESRYRFIDLRPHLSATLYYRLKMTELDESFSYSKIIALLSTKSEENFTVFPVPAHDFIWVGGQGIWGRSLKLINAQGVVLKTIQAVSKNQKIDVSLLSPGIYFIQTSTGHTRKIVKE